MFQEFMTQSGIGQEHFFARKKRLKTTARKWYVVVNNVTFAIVAMAAVGCSTVAQAETFSLDGSRASTAAETSDSDVVKIRGKGMGTDRAAALNAALRDAVERAVGQFVDAETFVKNDQLIKDQVLTFSNAYVQKYDVVSESAEAGKGIAVMVRRRRCSTSRRSSTVIVRRNFSGSDSTSRMRMPQMSSR